MVTIGPTTFEAKGPRMGDKGGISLNNNKGYFLISLMPGISHAFGPQGPGEFLYIYIYIYIYIVMCIDARRDFTSLPFVNIFIIIKANHVSSRA